MPGNSKVGILCTCQIDEGLKVYKLQRLTHTDREALGDSWHLLYNGHLLRRCRVLHILCLESESSGFHQSCRRKMSDTAVHSADPIWNQVSCRISRLYHNERYRSNAHSQAVGRRTQQQFYSNGSFPSDHSALASLLLF